MKNQKDQLAQQFAAFSLNEVKTKIRIKGGQKKADSGAYVEHTYDGLSHDDVVHSDDPYVVRG